MHHFRIVLLPLSILALYACDTEVVESTTGAASIETTTVTIDTTKVGLDIPDNFVGLSFSRDNVGGSNYFHIFNEAVNPARYGQLKSLFKQIGIKHLRTVTDAAIPINHSTTPVQNPTQADDEWLFRFAKDAGLPEHSVIYSLHLFNEDTAQTTACSTPTTLSEWTNAPETCDANNLPSAAGVWALVNDPTSRAYHMLESFALDNEVNWNWHYHKPFIDDEIIGYLPHSAPYARATTEELERSIGFRDAWTKEYERILAKLGAKAPFSGPDTGGNFPVTTDLGGQSYVEENGVKYPFTLRFAKDHASHINLATQHYYGGDVDTPEAWHPARYGTDDAVLDDKDRYVYRCKDGCSGDIHPADSSEWALYRPIWNDHTSYDGPTSTTQGDVVQDPGARGGFYECVRVTGCASSTTAPHDASQSEWLAVQLHVLTALQMAKHMLDPARDRDYDILDHEVLAGRFGWPRGMRYRFTEANAYSGGRNTRYHEFATALWAVDFFHWWAARGCAGIDPFTHLPQYNAPLFEIPKGQKDAGNIVASPLAYGMMAFSKGSHGTYVKPEGVTFSRTYDWLTSYAVVDRTHGHLYVTLVNKTFHAIGASDAVLTIKTPGFGAKGVTALLLTSGHDADVTRDAAYLGGATIPNDGTDWKGTWSYPATVDKGGVSVTVHSGTAVVLDITSS